MKEVKVVSLGELLDEHIPGWGYPVNANTDKRAVKFAQEARSNRLLVE